MTDTYKGKAYANISTSVDNHLAAFAAESSRLSDKVVDMSEYKKELHNSIS